MASKLLSNEFQKHICLDYECTTIEEAIANFKKFYDRDPSKNDLFFLESFCE